MNTSASRSATISSLVLAAVGIVTCSTFGDDAAQAPTNAASATAATQRSAVQPLPDLSTTPTLFVCAYAHLDTQWRWCYPQVIREFIKNTLDDNFRLFDKYPNYVFNFSGSRRYQMMAEYYPEQYARLKNEVAAGRWFPCGSSVDENDANVPSAESYVRHVLYGNRFFRREFGIASDEYMLPDCFGFPAAVPSLLAHCGITQFSTQKLTWNAVVPIPFKVGVWNGPDGRGVVAALDPGSYGGEVLENLAQSNGWKTRIDANGKRSGVFADFHYYGTGDEGGAPTERSVAMMETSLATSGGLKIMAGSADQLVHSITPDMRAKLPVYSGELQLTEHSAGSITSQAYMKRWNRKNELLADSAEKASVFAHWLGGRDYPAAKLEEAWTLILGSQMHDILPGTSHPWAYELSWNDEILAGNTLSTVLTDAAGVVASQLDTAGAGTPLVIFNPLSFDRSDVVEATIPLAADAPPANVTVTGPDGSAVPAQILESDQPSVRVAFLAKVPSLGFAVYHVNTASAPSQPKSELAIDERGISSSRYAVSLDEHGNVASVRDKQNNRELLSGPATLALHYENPQNWPAWNQDWADRQLPAKEIVGGKPVIRVLERGPARAALEVTREVGGSTFTQRIRLGAGDAGDRIEFDCTIDWVARERSLRAAFPLNVANPNATYDIQTGTIQRGNGHDKQYEYAFQQWFDLTDSKGDYGVTIMSDSKYGADKASDSLVRLTLLHTPGTRGGYQDQGSQDVGRHHVQYAISGHVGDWRDGRSATSAARLNQPLLAFVSPAHPGPLGKSVSLLRVSNSNVLVTAMKKAEDSDEIIVRLRELSGKDQSGVALSAPAAILSAREVDGQERPIADVRTNKGSLVADIGAYQLRAFAIKFAPSPHSTTPAPAVALSVPFDTDVVAPRSARTDGSMNESGDAFPAEQFPKTVTSGDAVFTLGPATSGSSNALSCRGQTLTLPKGAVNRVYLLAASSESDVDTTISTGDATLPVRFRDWRGVLGQWDRRLWIGDIPEYAFDWPYELGGIEPGYIKPEPVAWYASHYSTTKSDAHYRFCYLYKVALDVPQGCTSITLPNDPRIKVFAACATNSSTRGFSPASTLFDRLDQRTQDAPRVDFDPPQLNDATTVSIQPRLYWKKGSIRYTLDGTAPTASSPAYSAPLTLSQTTTIKAAVFAGDQPGPVSVTTLPINDTTAPTITHLAATFKQPALHVQFSEPIASPDASNFKIAPDIAIRSVTLSENARSATIALAGPPETDKPYTLAVSNLRDNAPTPNVIKPTSLPFIARGPVFTLADIPRDSYGKSINNVPNLPVKAGDSWTINLFVKLDTQPDNRTIIAGFGECNDKVSGQSRYLAKFAGGAHFWSRGRDASSKTPIDLNRWQMLTATYDGATIHLYKDAQLIGSRTAQLADDSPTINIAPLDPWERKRTFNGDIRDFTIWNTCLTPDALQTLLNSNAHR